MRIVKPQFVQHNVAAEQWPQLHIDDGTADVGYGVLLLHDAHAVDLQVEGEA